MLYRLHTGLVRQQKRHPWRFAAVIVVVVIFISGFATFLARPAEGKNTFVDLPIKRPTHRSATLPASTLDNQYFKLMLPVGYRISGGQNNTGDALRVDTIIKPSGFGSAIISVAIVTKPSGGVSELTSYRVRAEASSSYQIADKTIGGDQLKVASRLGGEAGEVVAFWPHAGYVATIAVSSGEAANGSDIDINQAILQTILKNWQWH